VERGLGGEVNQGENQTCPPLSHSGGEIEQNRRKSSLQTRSINEASVSRWLQGLIRGSLADTAVSFKGASEGR